MRKFQRAPKARSHGDPGAGRQRRVVLGSYLTVGDFLSAPESIFNTGEFPSALSSGGTPLGEDKRPGATLSGGALCCAGEIAGWLRVVSSS